MKNWNSITNYAISSIQVKHKLFERIIVFGTNLDLSKLIQYNPLQSGLLWFPPVHTVLSALVCFRKYQSNPAWIQSNSVWPCLNGSNIIRSSWIQSSKLWFHPVWSCCSCPYIQVRVASQIWSSHKCSDLVQSHLIPTTHFNSKHVKYMNYEYIT